MPTGEQKQKQRTFDVLPKPDKLIRYRQACARSTDSSADSKGRTSVGGPAEMDGPDRRVAVKKPMAQGRLLREPRFPRALARAPSFAYDPAP